MDELDVTVATFPGVLGSAECEHIIERARSSGGQEITPPGGGQLVAHPVDDFDARLGRGIRNRLWTLVFRFNRARGWRIPFDLARAGVSLYPTGGSMGYHVDDEERNAPPWDLPHRGVSMSIPLSTPTGYTGGELCLFDERGHAVPAPPLGRGDALCFGSSTPHEVTEVIDGERWVLLFWAYTNHNRRPIR